MPEQVGNAHTFEGRHHFHTLKLEPNHPAMGARNDHLKGSQRLIEAPEERSTRAMVKVVLRRGFGNQEWVDRRVAD